MCDDMFIRSCIRHDHEDIHGRAWSVPHLWQMQKVNSVESVAIHETSWRDQRGQWRVARVSSQLLSMVRAGTDDVSLVTIEQDTFKVPALISLNELSLI